MSNMKDREQGFERKFVLDEETRFKAMAGATSCSACGPPKSSASRAPMPTPMPRKWSSPTSRKPATTTCCARSAAISTPPASTQSDEQIRKTMDELMAVAVEQIQAG